ncbi:nickel pincer cofactor biosynthesis protein LarB [Mucisphaera calidilacus]|uniref:AIR carboxylase n=1 Tax=Mucisphaera calidilacus TaxID=2527982 RepID=A0A518BVY4_9BACT|nr:nickel pincer cofactor biosynthesis protein LarB [Mucisphaera calidilacus]QDU71139.1 AIR carboxylase [Mucisphaera calidilacus]
MSQTQAPIDEVLDALSRGEIDQAEARERLLSLQARPLGFATLDLDRPRRCGAAEVIFAEGKTPEQVVAIVRTLREQGGCVLATRCTDEQVAMVQSAFGGNDQLLVDALARTIIVGDPPAPADAAPVCIVTAGTSDLPVAREALSTCVAYGQPAELIVDVGVAGLHRLLGRLDTIKRSSVVITVAGMEAALPSVMGGLIEAPIIAVPTSVGYGSHFEGLAALLSCLNACASGIATVNIDNGFGAAVMACRINALAHPNTVEAS